MDSLSWWFIINIVNQSIHPTKGVTCLFPYDIAIDDSRSMILVKEISSTPDPRTQQVNNSQRTQSQWSLQKLLDQRQADKTSRCFEHLRTSKKSCHENGWFLPPPNLVRFYWGNSMDEKTFWWNSRSQLLNVSLKGASIFLGIATA